MSLMKAEPSAAPGVIPPLPPLSSQRTERDDEVVATAKSSQLRAGRKGQVAATAAAGGDDDAVRAKRIARARSAQEAVQKANEALEAFDATAVKLFYDNKRDLVLIQVVKAGGRPGEKEQLIRQIPPEEMIKLADQLEELRGVLFDQQV